MNRLISLLFILILFIGCKTETTINKKIFVNINTGVTINDSLFYTINYSDSLLPDSNNIYYVFIDSKNINFNPDTLIEQVVVTKIKYDTVYMPLIKEDNQITITWTHQDTTACKFLIVQQGQDTTIEYRPEFSYIPADTDTFKYEIKYDVNMTIGKYKKEGNNYSAILYEVYAEKNGVNSLPSFPVMIIKKEE